MNEQMKNNREYYFKEIAKMNVSSYVLTLLKNAGEPYFVECKDGSATFDKKLYDLACIGSWQTFHPDNYKEYKRKFFDREGDITRDLLAYALRAGRKQKRKTN